MQHNWQKWYTHSALIVLHLNDVECMDPRLCQAHAYNVITWSGIFNSVFKFLTSRILVISVAYLQVPISTSQCKWHMHG